ncbi:hypothetical protein [Methylorubrum suomiense]|uniref:Uncharacterized protein n=1 Tax=Methylorubrum suomiense TaxID=144191 RepID=A0ABQ4V0M1_9HYPH|nr:hypothetical protein [Methylorubrum suomiense]GJE78146.1 hypothetical protein BGCPKDLD_4757 [Methylorubrum suomiense]
MSTKILIGLAELQGLIAGKPEIEVQLLEKAVPQLAGLLARKVEERAGALDERIRQAVDLQLRQIGSGYGRMSEATRIIIRDMLKEELDKYGRSLVLQSIDQHLRPEIKKLFDDFKTEALRAVENREITSRDTINNYAKAAAEREVLALMRGMGAQS